MVFSTAPGTAAGICGTGGTAGIDGLTTWRRGGVRDCILTGPEVVRGAPAFGTGAETGPEATRGGARTGTRPAGRGVGTALVDMKRPWPAPGGAGRTTGRTPGAVGEPGCGGDTARGLVDIWPKLTLFAGTCAPG